MQIYKHANNLYERSNVTGNCDMTKPELNITFPFFSKKKERNNAILSPKLTLAKLTEE